MKERRWQVLARLANQHGWTSMAELGVFQGKTSAYLLKHTKLSLLMVDTWKPGIEDTPAHLKKGPQDTGARSYVQYPLHEYRVACERLALAYPGRATVMPMTTLEAAEQVEDGSLCAVFIDADHMPAAVEADIRAWAPKIRPGGMITGHDANMPCLAKVLDRVLPGWTGHDDSVWTVPIEDVRP